MIVADFRFRKESTGDYFLPNNGVSAYKYREHGWELQPFSKW